MAYFLLSKIPILARVGAVWQMRVENESAAPEARAQHATQMAAAAAYRTHTVSVYMVMIELRLIVIK
jgi:hypothetical protein